ncbi:hypothetical protein [Streptomyces sp. NPDC047999]|uniref:hypothetical protein n=1 Tax=unclassified Streptomyces TaxID=2593676 RepID=UPI003721043D
MPEADGTDVDAAALLALALRHLDDHDTRRPFTRIPTLDDSTTQPFRPFPALAVAMAGYVLSAWEVRTFRIERARPGERIRFFTAQGGDPRRVFRACTLFDAELGTQRVAELCGHSLCTNKAPLGPGSRCADHLGDPVPDGCAPGYWLHTAGAAARSVENGRGALTETEGLAVHAVRSGLPVREVSAATGLREWAVRVLTGEPARVPEGVDDSDDPACWPLVLAPVRDITAADVHRVRALGEDGGPAEPAPEAVLARADRWYFYEPLRENGPFLVQGEEDCAFTLEWWQVQDHLPEHRLARLGDERRRRELYEPPCSCDDCCY